MGNKRLVPLLTTMVGTGCFDRNITLSTLLQISRISPTEETTDDQVAAFVKFSDIEWFGTISKPKKPKLGNYLVATKMAAKRKRGPRKHNYRVQPVFFVSGLAPLKDSFVEIRTVESDYLSGNLCARYNRVELSSLLNRELYPITGCTHESKPEEIVAVLLNEFLPDPHNFIYRPIEELAERPGVWKLQFEASEYSLVYKGKATIYVQFLP